MLSIQGMRRYLQKWCLMLKVNRMVHLVKGYLPTRVKITAIGVVLKDIFLWTVQRFFFVRFVRAMNM